MRSGEWTRGMSLVLASAVEALEVKEGSSPTSILRRLKWFSPESINSRGPGEGAHLDEWHLVFGPAEPNVFDLSVNVSLPCDGLYENHPRYGHRWCDRTVEVVQPNDTRPGEYHFVYEGKAEEPLKGNLEDCWSADN